MKKISLVSNENIRKHLANTSPAKITHSFSKSRRFLDPNPEYPFDNPDANRPTTVALLHSPNVTVASALVIAPISPRAPSSHQPRPPTALHHSSTNWVKPTASVSVAKSRQKGTISTTSAKHAFQDQAQYLVYHTV